jgi:hypothetical protein
MSYPSLTLPPICSRNSTLKKLAEISSIWESAGIFSFSYSMQDISKFLSEHKNHGLLEDTEIFKKPYFLDSSNLPRLRLISNIFSAWKKKKWRRNTF